MRFWLALGVLAAEVAWAQAPAYIPDNIVNASDFRPGPFAPNSVLSIFGSNLSWTTRALVSEDIVAGNLPSQLGGVEVYVDNWPSPLLYVSPAQINFVIPGNEIGGEIKLRVVRQGVTGPEVKLMLTDAAPALFAPGPGFVVAAHADCSLITGASPAHPGDMVVVYATGLGQTQPNPAPGAIPLTAATMLALPRLTVSLDGVPLPSFRIKYAGLTPYSAGLYQLNIELPATAGADPEILVTVDGQSSAAGLKILVRQ